MRVYKSLNPKDVIFHLMLGKFLFIHEKKTSNANQLTCSMSFCLPEHLTEIPRRHMFEKDV